MYSNSSARKSADSISPVISPNAHRTDFPFHRRGSTTSSIYSIGGSPDTTSSNWPNTMLEVGQNAISTLLQSPIVRTGLLPHTSAPASSAHKPPTTRDIPPVTLTNITHIDAAEFQPYLTQVGALYEQLQTVKESQDEAVNILSRRSSKDAPSPIGGSSVGFARRAAQGPPPLSTIPPVYFDENFHLENPRTFDVVSERSEVVRPLLGTLDEKDLVNDVAAPWKALVTNAILQEKLSWYMDIIEIYLIASISIASTTFFTALGSLRELHSEAADYGKRVKALRKELEALDQEIASSGLNIVQKRQRRENLQQLHDAVLQLKLTVDSVSICESFVNNGEVEKALEGIDSLENLIAGRPDFSKTLLKMDSGDLQLRDLRGVAALQGINNNLNTLRSQISTSYETRFLSLLMKDLQRHSDTVSVQEVLIRWASASVRSRDGHMRGHSASPSYMTLTDGLRSELKETLIGLRRTKHLTTAATAYREVVLKEIRKQYKSSIAALNPRALGPKEAEELLIKIYISATETLRRLTTQVKLLLDVASSSGDNSIEAQKIHQAIDLPSLLGQAVDIAQDQIVKLLQIRSDQSTHLSLIWFLRYFTLNLHFANECESISGRSGIALKTIVNGQIKDFVQQHGDTEKQKLALDMESDKWEAKDFSEKNTAKLNLILSCSTNDPADWLDGLKIWVPYSDNPEANEVGDSQPNSDGKVRTRNASIDEEIFVLPNSAILCMDGLTHFLQLIVGIPSMTSEIGASLVSYLQLFNSRCTQLILGAGARRSAGLRAITSKHLALASRALEFIATLISHVREFFRRHARNSTATSITAELDNVRRLYEEYQNNIYDKIVEIMSRLAASHVKAIKSIDWENGQKSVHPYMATLVKDTTSLHRTLTKALPEGTIRIIMTPVFTGYRDQFGKAFQGVDPNTESGRDSMLHDVEFFESKLSKMDGYGDTGEYLTTIIKSKHIESLAAAELEKKDTEENVNSSGTRDD
ncbi:Vps54-like protein-domain-containing protein [Annulohypoxylon moriforme]|nr:Vps54-like protein-domain-containing protein [Annulohypoxylon moriforme]